MPHWGLQPKQKDKGTHPLTGKMIWIVVLIAVPKICVKIDTPAATSYAEQFTEFRKDTVAVIQGALQEFKSKNSVDVTAAASYAAMSRHMAAT